MHIARNITPVILYLLLLISCGPAGNKGKSKDRVLVPDPEHSIKDNWEVSKFDSAILFTGWYYIVDSVNGYKRQLNKSTKTYFVDRHPIVSAVNFTTLEIYQGNADGVNYSGLAMHLDNEGTAKWSIATEKSIGGQLAFILDNRLLVVAKVNAQDTGGITALNSPDYSRQELENYKTVIESER